MSAPFPAVTLDAPVPADELPDEVVEEGADQGDRPEEPVDSPEPDVP